MFGFSTVEILLAVLNFLVFVLILVLVRLGSNLSSLGGAVRHTAR